MFKGDWKCSGCGKSITELPFEPKNTSNLTCRDCYSSGKVVKKPQGEKKMFQGNWKCNTCGGEINQLPFEPKSTNNLTCRECYMKTRG